MKKFMTSIKTLAALLMAGAAFSACSSSDDNIANEQPANPTQPQVYTMVIKASKGGDATTRALQGGDGSVTAYWNGNEAIDVVQDNGTTKEKIGTATAAESSDGSTTITATLTSEPTGDLYFVLGGTTRNYTGQNGILAAPESTQVTNISKDYDFAVAELAADKYTKNGTVITPGATLNFVSSQAIVKFTLIAEATATPINATQLTIDAKVNGESRLIQSMSLPSTQTLGPITINRTAPADNVIYAALPFSSQASFTFDLTATDGKYTYTYEKADVTMLNGRYYEVTVKMNDAQPLTFEAREAGASVRFGVDTEVATNGVEYSTDGSSWTAYTSGTSITLANVGDRVMFRGNNATYARDGSSSTFSCTKPCYVYGNIMSLITPTGFEKATTLTEPYTFKYLFDGNSNIDIHPIQKLLLPATTLTEKCYYGMFRNCYGLTKAPELPAMTMAKACYSKMFYNCTALVETPNLPATTLADECYSEMFVSCSSLKTPPAILPATTLAGSCYYRMFYQCTNLESAPDLPATQLVGACYLRMFYNCNKINSITCLATDFYGDCTSYWLYGVASSGTFTKASSATWTSGYSGIPDGWSVEETTHL